MLWQCGWSGTNTKRQKDKKRQKGKKTKGQKRRAQGEGRREKGEGRREKGEGRREKGEGRREKGEGRKETETLTRMSDDNVSKQGTTCTIMLRPLNGMSKVLCKNDYEGAMVETEGARDV